MKSIHLFFIIIFCATFHQTVFSQQAVSIELAFSYPVSHNSLNYTDVSSEFIRKKNLDIALISADAGLCITGFLLIQKPVLSETDLLLIDTSSVPEFEKYLIHKSSEPFANNADKLSDYFLYGAFAAPLLASVFSGNHSDDIYTNLMMYAEGLLMTLGTTEILKRALQRNRPYVFNEALTTEERRGEKAAFSFPSGHTSNTAFQCFFAASLLTTYYPAQNSKALKICTWSAATMYPLVTGYLRTEAGVHFWTDVAAGYLLGAGIGLAIPALHREDISSISLIPFQNRLGSGLTFSCRF